ncbi:hypothetical protein [Micromonospora eburnea]|uniref:Uncharacterized protein n=1 Tax=Micromonospora eburnea TaxID=227316 RepID=A0A1C6UHQ5_9ACTN|nr:hypothetical protein [Micromonospora eburnea]SCL53501.1 hypothetical protein GA0070604_2791 [Micromonospora eburnea]
MPETTRIWPSQDAVLPEDVTDPLLWRLAYDVAVAHQPDAAGHCASLLCAGQGTPCAPLVNARRAMLLARGGAPGSAPVPAQWDWRREAA